MKFDALIYNHAWESRDLCCGKQPNEFGGVRGLTKNNRIFALK